MCSASSMCINFLRICSHRPGSQCTAEGEKQPAGTATAAARPVADTTHLACSDQRLSYHTPNSYQHSCQSCAEDATTAAGPHGENPVPCSPLRRLFSEPLSLACDCCLQKELIMEAHAILKKSDKLTSREKQLILGFMGGCRGQ